MNGCPSAHPLPHPPPTAPRSIAPSGRASCFSKTSTPSISPPADVGLERSAICCWGDGEVSKASNDGARHAAGKSCKSGHTFRAAARGNGPKKRELPAPPTSNRIGRIGKGAQRAHLGSTSIHRNLCLSGSPSTGLMVDPSTSILSVSSSIVMGQRQGKLMQRFEVLHPPFESRVTNTGPEK